MKFKIGDEVIVVNDPIYKDLNGRVGRVVEFDHAYDDCYIIVYLYPNKFYPETERCPFAETELVLLTKAAKVLFSE